MSSRKLKSNNIENHLKAAIKNHELGYLDQSEKVYSQVLERIPNHPVALHFMGLLQSQRNNLKKGLELINRALVQNPRYHAAYTNLGNIYYALSDFDNTRQCFEKALELRPDDPLSHNNLAGIYRTLGDREKAEKHFKEAISLKPDYAEAHHNLGVFYYDQGLADKAMDQYQKAIQFNPKFGLAYNSLGIVYKEKNDNDQALKYYFKAIELKPQLAKAYNNIGVVYAEINNISESMRYFQKCLELDPEYTGAYINLGFLYKDIGQIEKALDCFQQAYALSPNNAETANALYHLVRYVCDWSKLKELEQKIDAITNLAIEHEIQPYEMPFENLLRHPDPEINYQVAKRWSEDLLRRRDLPEALFSFEQCRQDKPVLRIGYLSNNFGNHSMGYLIPRLLQEHNQQKYFITVYSYGLDQESDTSKKIRIHAHLYRDLKDLTDRQSAEKIHQDQIDILVDLNGHLKGSRLGICALRPVPIQVRYLGMAGTTGAPFFDYIITDRIVTPPEQSKFYSEAFAYMPHTYQVNDYVLQGQVNSLTRKKCHLSDQAFVFACFCSLYKIDPPIFDAWMQILKAVPESVLWLLQGNQQAVLNLRQEAQKRDVDPSRLVFAEHLEKTTHLQRIELADLALDTRIVNGAATTSDALWAGLPVVTIQGTHFASRMSSSLLTAIDLTELITHSLDDYVNLAVGLARNREHLEKIRKRLKVNKFTKPLFNAPLFTVNLENLYRWMWEKRFTVHG